MAPRFLGFGSVMNDGAHGVIELGFDAAAFGIVPLTIGTPVSERATFGLCTVNKSDGQHGVILIVYPTLCAHLNYPTLEPTNTNEIAKSHLVIISFLVATERNSQNSL